MLFSLNSNYEVRDQRFSITRVVDDQIFTYIQLAKSQNRPAVYFGKSPDLKKLEPVKYTDEGDYYTVHRVLGLSERLYLKLGDDTSEVRTKAAMFPESGRQRNCRPQHTEVKSSPAGSALRLRPNRLACLCSGPEQSPFTSYLCLTSLADFERLSWHDCHVYALKITEGEHGTGELELDIDFIVEWLCHKDQVCQFRVAPATLTFHQIFGLRVELDYASVGAGIYSVLPRPHRARSHFIFHRSYLLPVAPGSELAVGFNLLRRARVHPDTSSRSASHRTQALNPVQRRQLSSG